MKKIDRFCTNCISKTDSVCTLHERKIKSGFDSCVFFSATVNIDQAKASGQNSFGSLMNKKTA